MGTKEEYEARKRADDAERDKRKWWFNQIDPIARLTGWLVAFTGLLFIATIASVVALIVTDHTLKNTAKRQLRAYVFLDKAVVTLEGRKLKGVAELKNSGQTPAYDFTAAIRLHTRPSGVKFIPESFDEEPLAQGIIGPGTSVSPTSDVDIPAKNEGAIPALKEGRATIYLNGKARYRDAFNRVWILDFRVRSHAFDETNNRWLMAPTEEGNTERQEK